ncbi:hypothetical protein WMY93_015342 [Mugilogobius chulae]|uniref:DUF5641 domain-containing protein n=1 Tax=Mugilogobius chulae TaxID=88201 RepID=A0AAW0NWX7_9GOBI
MTVPSERVSGLCVRGFNSDLKIDLPVTYTKDCIPLDITHIPTRETARKWKHLSEIVEKMQPLRDCEVGLLIGYNCSRAMAPRQFITGGDDEPYAIRTDLGWSIVGGNPQYGDPFKSHICYRTITKEQPSLRPVDAVRVLESDFKDFADDEAGFSQDDVAFLNAVGIGIQKNELGHYEMPLPFKKRPILPNNKEMALVRLNHLKRKLQRNQDYKEQYIKFMEEIIESGMQNKLMMKVVREKHGISLNAHLLTGPDLLNGLLGILLRFRQHPVAMLCDVEKMFHQFHVAKEDRNFLRFLWWKGGDLNSRPSEFRMKVHLFGAASSPGCANYGLKHLAKEYSTVLPEGSQFILRDFYVDDGLTSVESTAQAIKLAMEATDICAKGGLRLHKFISNDRAVIDSIPEAERAPNVRDLDLSFENLPLERALGVQWNVEADEFTFLVNLKMQPATRRGILSTVASLYDPLGFVAPVLLKAKGILQEMCRHGIAWDDSISKELLPQWIKWKEELVDLTRISISRTYVPSGFGRILKIELHHFSDASTRGYGQCSYIRFKNERGDVHCTLAMGKSRVAPLKVTTIPRLELTAAVVAVQASALLKRELLFQDMTEYFWTDSCVVLGYIKNEARRFHTFVANRVQKIHSASATEQWRYVPTEENPADHASRGLTPKELLASNWLSGPKFLWERELVMPNDKIPEISIQDPEGLKDASLRTFFYEAMAIVNSRPLTVDSLCSPRDPLPLTPNHLLTMKPARALPPPGNFVPEDVYSKRQWRQVQYLAEQFWSRWRKEYLANICSRQCWREPRRNLQMGDIVILKDDDAPRNEWKLGRVLETMPGKDGLVRKVRLMLGDRRFVRKGEQITKTSEVERPIQKLVVLVEAAKD